MGGASPFGPIKKKMLWKKVRRMVEKGSSSAAENVAAMSRQQQILSLATFVLISETTGTKNDEGGLSKGILSTI